MEYNVNQEDLAKVSVVLQNESLWEAFDEAFGLPVGTTQYC